MKENQTGRLIRELRIEKGLTQIQLAKKIHISNRAISKWENGDGMPDVSILPSLAQALDTSVDELLNGKRANNDSTARPEPIFVFEGEPAYRDTLDMCRVLIKQKISNLTLIALTATAIMINVTLFLFQLPYGRLVNLINTLYITLLILRFTFPFLYARALVKDNKALVDNGRVRIEVSDKIYRISQLGVTIFNFSNITSIVETKEQLVFTVNKRVFAGFTKRELVKGDIDAFREFIYSKTPNVNPKKTSKIGKAVAIFIIAATIILFLLNIVGIIVNHEYNYSPSIVSENTAYFEEHRALFDNAVVKIEADEEIKRDIEEVGVASYSAYPYIDLDEIYDIEAGKDYITIYKYSNCITGYVHYEGDDIPYPYQLGYEHSRLEEQELSFDEENQIYTVRADYSDGNKDENRSKEDYYIIKVLDDDWYYYEYYSDYYA